jgi:phi LC3 family holin
MKINWKARFKNKAFIVTFVTLIVTFVYQVLGILDIVPSVSENDVMNIAMLLVNVLGALGVLVDPTTDGFGDSERALTYFTENDVRNADNTIAE